ncbi:hypothetical protein CAEBREN_18634, partial [Caenorhabditis brenneri]
MRILFVIFVALIAFQTFTDAQKSENSSLERLTEDFRVLSRVSNAISLRASAVQKTLQTRFVISEFLNIAEKQFSDLVNIDTESSISMLKKLMEKVKTFSTASLSSTESLRETEDRMKSVSDWMEDEEIKNALDYDEFGTKVDELMTKTTSLNLKCESQYRLSAVLSGRRLKKKLITVKNYIDGINSFLDCRKQIKELNSKIEKLGFWDVLYKHVAPMEVVKLLGETLRKLKEEFTKFKKDLKISKELWRTKNETRYLAAQIRDAFKAHKDHSTNNGPLLPTSTVGFLEPSEMLEVKNDLETKFFKKFFVQNSGNHFQRLKDWLTPFHVTSEVIQDLNKLWIEFDQVKLDQRNVLMRVSEKLEAFETFLEDLVPESIDKSLPILEKCTEDPEPSYEQSLEAFLKQEKRIERLKSKFLELQETIYSFGGMQQNSNFTLKECFEEVLDHLRNTDIHPEERVPQKIIRQTNFLFRNCAGRNQQHVGLAYVLEGVTEITLEIKRIQDTHGKKATTTDPHIDFKTVSDSSKAFGMLECLRKDDFEMDGLDEVINFVKSLREFPSSEELRFASNYMESLSKIKSVLSIVENQMFNSEKRPKRSPEESVSFDEYPDNSAEDLGVSVLALLDLIKVRNNREELLKIEEFHEEMKSDMKREGLNGFLDPGYKIKSLLNQADKVESDSKEFLKTGDLKKMAGIFEEVSAITGIVQDKHHLTHLIHEYEEEGRNEYEVKQLKLLQSTPLNFALYTSRLKDGENAVINIIEYFDQVFGRVKKRETRVIYASPLFIVGLCMGTGFLLVIGGLMIYGCTANGRAKYQNLYLYYFGKQADFEKRWRYSSFADEQDGKNTLLDAVREVNKTNLIAAVKKGAYINAYNNFGNTALHAATKGPYPELVEILIRHGADRSLLNVKNRTPEQMIPTKYEGLSPDKVEKYDKIKNIFKKYQKKKFKKSVPLKFPSTSFHIFIEDRTNNELTNRFNDAFESITSIEVSPTTTHLVVKTNPDGILETDRLDLLFWIFYGAIIVKESWMSDCLEDMRLINKDYNYLVEKVKYKGIIYNTVLQWSNAMAKSEIPYLYGVYVAVVMNEYANMQPLTSLVLCQGGIFLDEFPVKKNYRVGSRPYLHANLGPLFIIHDGK